MKIAFISSVYEPHRPGSGVGYFMAEAIKNSGAELEMVNLHKEPLRFFTRLFSAACRTLAGKRYNRTRSIIALRRVGARLSKMLKSRDFDAVVTFGSLPVAFLETDKPIIIWTDASFDCLLGYHPDYLNMPRFNIRNARIIEQRAIDKARKILVSTQWAKDSFEENYKVESGKISVVEFGANTKVVNTEETIRHKISTTDYSLLNLLFVARSASESKGFSIAVGVAKELRTRGINAFLHVLGEYSGAELPDFVVLHGFIDSSLEGSKSRLGEIFLQSNFFIMPTRHDTFGHVFAEANSYGIPALASATGGVPCVVRNGINGQTFTFENEVLQYSDFIESLWGDHEKYESLCLSSYNEFSNRLSWGRASEQLTAILGEVTRPTTNV